jgi:hypothetical protein
MAQGGIIVPGGDSQVDIRESHHTTAPTAYNQRAVRIEDDG